jgi:hypothetical protein
MITVTVILGDDGDLAPEGELPETLKSLTFEMDQIVHLGGTYGHDGNVRDIYARNLTIYHVIAQCCLAYDGKTLVPVHERGEG